MKQTSQKTGKNFISVSAVIFISKLLGFVRDIFFASIFGTTVLADIFQVIFSLPNLLFASIGNALSAVNIPDLTYFIKNRSLEERNRYMAQLLSYVTIIAALVSVAGMIMAPFIASIIAPGLREEVNDVAVILTRIMAPTLLFVCLTYITAGILQVHGYFVLSSTISIPFNLLIIGSLLISKDNIFIIGCCTTLGWLCQFLIQIPVLFKEKYHFQLQLNFKDPHVNNTLKNLIPILLGNALLHLSLILDRTYAMNLPEGSAAALSFGSNLFITITSVFIVAMSTVTFPQLSKYCIESNFKMAGRLITQSFKILLFILAPYLILVIMYNQNIVTLVYQRGAFGYDSTAMTSKAFLFYSLSVFGYACLELYNRAFFALKNFRVPMLVSIFCLALNGFLDYLFYETYGITALSLSTSICLIIYAIIMSVLLRKNIGNFFTKDLCFYGAKLILPALGMIACIQITRYLLPVSQNVLGFLFPLLASASVYLIIAYLCGLHRVFFNKGD
ncbi:MAG: murein biosynthesis integral membrane protein MurJ [Syntrophomonadaceae bacterium]|jgi:putative peptidoglycan lipid II flippase|nr:murein biosynthesis integral membrane protein MurJ [Syntrophomonadaceae bacterium]